LHISSQTKYETTILGDLSMDETSPNWAKNNGLFLSLKANEKRNKSQIKISW
jgi:hypothetical protein